jgi:hypothetical protein
MSGDDPIAAYLERVSRALSRWHPGRRRILAEIEDHLRERVDAGQTAEEAVRRFGDAAGVAAGLARAPRRAFAAVLALALALASGVTWVTFPRSSGPTPVRISASSRQVPASVVARADTSVRGHVGLLPTGVRVDAYAPLPGDEVLAFTAYFATQPHPDVISSQGGRLCYLTYVARARALPPLRRGGAEANGGAVDCRPDLTPVADMLLSGGSGLPFILFGTAPREATDLVVTDAHGRTRTFSLPRVVVRAEPSRQVVILDLTRFGIRSCDRVSLLADGRIIAHENFIPV